MDSIDRDFLNFLNDVSNKRIVFSAPFGIGKTYFLKHFAPKAKDYDFFYLFPVNYHVSSNEDIIDLLKYDIIKSLVEKGTISFESNEVKSWLSAVYSLGNKKVFQIVLSTLLSISQDIAANKLGINLNKQINDVTLLYEQIKAEKEKQDFKVVNDFISQMEINKFSFTGTDIITNFIKNNLKVICSEIEGEVESEQISTVTVKQKVLILDDLDRLDPEHLFRILNVFSAFQNKDENLFGFDKVIFVFDINNVQSIFYHKYGSRADFVGYINKFYSTRPYTFNNNLIKSHFGKYIDAQSKQLPTFSYQYELEFLYVIGEYLIELNIFTYRHLIELINSSKNENLYFQLHSGTNKDSIFPIYNFIKFLYPGDLQKVYDKLTGTNLIDYQCRFDYFKVFLEILVENYYLDKHIKLNEYKYYCFIVEETLVINNGKKYESDGSIRKWHSGVELLRLNDWTDIWKLLFQYFSKFKSF